MYIDYVNYLLAIKNNLIQCGIEIDKPLSAESDYSDVVVIEPILSDVIYFFKIMSVTNSPIALQGFFLPLEELYSSKIRKETYLEFINYVLPNYKKLVGDTGSSPYFEENFSDLGEDVLDSIFEEETSKERVSDELIEYQKNGVYLEDLIDDYRESFIPDESDEFFQDDAEYEESLWDEDDEELPLENEYIDSEYEESSWSDDEDDSYTDAEDSYVEESSWEEDDEESLSIEESSWGDDDDEGDGTIDEFSWEEGNDEYEESSWGEDEEESSWGEDEEEYIEESPYEDNDEEYIEESPYEDDDYEESPYEDDTDESPYEDDYEESSWGDDESPYEDDDYEESSWGDESESDQKKVSEPSRDAISSSPVDKDLGTVLQDKTNSALTSIKRGIGNFLYKK